MNRLLWAIEVETVSIVPADHYIPGLATRIVPGGQVLLNLGDL